MLIDSTVHGRIWVLSPPDQASGCLMVDFDFVFHQKDSSVLVFVGFEGLR